MFAPRRALSILLAAVLLAGGAGCGDDQVDKAAEKARQAGQDAQKKAEDAAKKAKDEADKAKKKAEKETSGY